MLISLLSPLFSLSCRNMKFRQHMHMFTVSWAFPAAAAAVATTPHAEAQPAQLQRAEPGAQPACGAGGQRNSTMSNREAGLSRHKQDYSAPTRARKHKQRITARLRGDGGDAARVHAHARSNALSSLSSFPEHLKRAVLEQVSFPRCPAGPACRPWSGRRGGRGPAYRPWACLRGGCGPAYRPATAWPGCAGRSPAITQLTRILVAASPSRTIGQ
jgi:hypothetical protein